MPLLLVLLAILLSASSVHAGGYHLNPAPFGPGTVQPQDMARADDGTVYFTAYNLNALGRIDVNGTLSTIPVVNSPQSVTNGRNGTIWFLGYGSVGRLTISTGEITYFPVAINGGVYSSDIIQSPDGYIWVVANCLKSIWRMTEDGKVREFSTGFGTQCPSDLAIGADGATWFADHSGSAVGRVTTNGNTTLYPIPPMFTNEYPNDLVRGGDGDLYTITNNGRIFRIKTDGSMSLFAEGYYWGRMDASTDGTLWTTRNTPGDIVEILQLRLSDGAVLDARMGVKSSAMSLVVAASNRIVVGHFEANGFTTVTATQVSTVPAAVVASQPVEIAAGSDGRVWYTEPTENSISVMTRSGAVNRYSIPSGDSRPSAIVRGADGAMWFTEANGDSVGRIAGDGSITEVPVTPYGEGSGIAADTHGNIWYALKAAGRIGRIAPPSSVTEFPLSSSVKPTRLAVAGDGDVWFAVDGSAVVGRLNPFTKAETYYPLVAPVTDVISLSDGRVAVSSDDKIFLFSADGAQKVISARGGLNRIAQRPNGDFVCTFSGAGEVLIVNDSGTKAVTLPMGSAPWGVAEDGSGLTWVTARNGGGVFSMSLAVDDVDQSGAADLLLRNSATGQNAVWLLANGQFSAIKDLPALANPDYELCASGDFNSDLEPELVWRNSTTGQNALWDLKNGNVTVFDLPGVGGDFKIVAAADFDGNGSDDLVWRNPTTGQNALWLMNGRQFSTIVDLPAVPGANLRIVAAADMNTDGFVDLVWRNATNGSNSVWTMHGTSLTDVATLPALPNTSYVIGGVTDTDGDGENDIVWRNQATGQNAIWRFNGLQFLGVTDLPALTNTNWTFVGPR